MTQSILLSVSFLCNSSICSLVTHIHSLGLESIPFTMNPVAFIQCLVSVIAPRGRLLCLSTITKGLIFIKMQRQNAATVWVTGSSEPRMGSTALKHAVRPQISILVQDYIGQLLHFAAGAFVLCL